MAKFLAKKPIEGGVEFVLGNGLRLVGLLHDMPEEMRERLALHGLSQKVGDSAAGCSKGEDFSGAFRAMQATLDALCAGVWSTRGVGSSDLVEALVRLGMAEDDEDAQALVDGMDEETHKEVQKHPQVKEVLQKIRAERAAEAAKAAADTAPDLGEMLAKFKKQ